MPIEVMVKEATGLPDKYVDMVVSYIRFLQYQVDVDNNGTRLKPMRKMGIMADKFHFIADDFDETPDCFEKYIRYVLKRGTKISEAEIAMIDAASVMPEEYDEDNPEIDPVKTPELYAALVKAVGERNRRISRRRGDNCGINK